MSNELSMRALYGLVYAAGADWLRTAIWTVGLLASVYLLIPAL